MSAPNTTSRTPLGLVARHPVAAFLVMLYAIGWTIFLPVVLAERGLLILPIDLSEGFAFNMVTSLASILGIALPAFLVTAATGGKAGVRNLLHRCLRWRVGIGWYLIHTLCDEVSVVVHDQGRQRGKDIHVFLPW